MSGTKFIVAGDAERATALQSALLATGAETEILDAEDLPEALVRMEASLNEDRPDAAICVGVDDDSLALAITASKLGVPLAACLEETTTEDKRRILVTLAALDAGAEPDRAADVITTWLSESSSAGT